jgi:fibronectin-binding autotransporter adhesin
VEQGTDLPTGGALFAASNDSLGTGPVQIERGILVIQPGVTIANAIEFTEGGIVVNEGTLNNSITDSFNVAQVVNNAGTINGNVLLGGAHDIVQLLTGSKITGRVDLGTTMNAQLILDGTGNELLSQGVVGTITNNGSLTKQGSGTWTIDRALSAPTGTDILDGTLIVAATLTTAVVNISGSGTLQLNSGGSVGNLVDDGSLVFASSAIV